VSEVIIIEVVEQGPPGTAGPASGATKRNPNLLPETATNNSFGGFIFSSSSELTGNEAYNAAYGLNSAGFYSAPSLTDAWWMVESPEPILVYSIEGGFYGLDSMDGITWQRMKAIDNVTTKYTSDLYGQWGKFFRLKAAIIDDTRSSSIAIFNLQLKRSVLFGVMDFGGGSTTGEVVIQPVFGQTVNDVNHVFFQRRNPTTDHNDQDHKEVALVCSLSQIPQDGGVYIEAISSTPLTGKYHVSYV